MLKNLILLLLLLSFQCINAQIKLTHNIGEDLVDSGLPSCEEDEVWGRVFQLSDFGVTTNEQFLVRSIEVGISKSYNGANLQYSVLSVDSNFPNSEPVLLGYGGYMLLTQIDTPEIIKFDLELPIVVPAGVERIMIAIGKSPDSYNPNSAEVVIAGTAEDRDDSWYRGCRKYYTYTSTEDLEVPVQNANFYINATGETFTTANSGATTTLNHSICDDLIDQITYGCHGGGMSWSRDFVLNDFGISGGEEFIIDSGQIGLDFAHGGGTIQFRIFEIDDNFPESFSEADLIGSSQELTLNYFNSRVNATPEIINLKFDTPVVIPGEVKRILVEVYQTKNLVFASSTAQDDGSISWVRAYNGGCTPFGEFLDIRETAWPNTKLYINVTGNVTNTSNSFGMNITNNCSEFLTEFSLTNTAAVASVHWNFGDPASGAENTSADLSPFHDFSADGTYTITATVKGKDGKVEVITETIDAKEPPVAYGISNMEACETTSGSGISTFNTSDIKLLVLGNQTNKVITFIDGSGNTYDVLPNPFINSRKNRETITVRVAREEELCCYSETSFDLIVNPLPDLSDIQDLFLCENDDDGFTAFDLTPIQADLSINNIHIDFYFQDGEQIPDSQLDAVTNKIKDRETITVKAANTVTGCSQETTFKIGVTPPPVAKTLTDLTGCDDNNDGISEYFNTSQVEPQVLGDQSGMEVSYFTEAGTQLTNPLPNPYTNTKANEEIILVRVTNPETGCFAETSLKLITSSKPRVNEPATLYACDSGNGSASFNTSTIDEQIIGNQSGLLISYYDEDGDRLTNFNSSPFTNSVPFEQQIMARIEDPNSTACATEVTFSLKTVSPPEIALKDQYEICSMGESLELKANPGYSSWTWFGPEGNVISEGPMVNITAEGFYGLSVLEEKNGIICENYKEFELIHSEAPVIENILSSNFSENTSIEVIASGDGVFEYSIDGLNFQTSNIFPKIPGGTYVVTVRDINGCGEFSQNINVVNFPRFFTPNNDGYHDSWHLQGLPPIAARILIYDRYGKLLKQLSTTSAGWDGTFNGRDMPSDDYWFHLNSEDGTTFKGHFSLVR